MNCKLIGQRIKERRESLSISPKEIASELGITARAYLNLEEGLVDIKCSNLIILRELLKTTVGYFFDEDLEGNTVHNSVQKVENLGVLNEFNKDLSSKIFELYERIIELEKKTS